MKCDFRKYFDSVDHAILKSMLSRIIQDERFLRFVFKIIDHQVPDEPLGKGLPIGNLTSQNFANYYLSAFDRRMEEWPGTTGYVRYMDDFICFSQSKETLNNLLDEIRSYAKDRLDLTLKEKVTTLAPVSEGVNFLGFRVYKNVIRIQRRNLNRLRKNVRLLERLYSKGTIPQQRLTDSVRSMIGHVLCADSTHIREEIFSASYKLG